MESLSIYMQLHCILNIRLSLILWERDKREPGTHCLCMCVISSPDVKEARIREKYRIGVVRHN